MSTVPTAAAPPEHEGVSSYLHVSTLLRLLLVMLLSLAPHFQRLPKWETAVVLALLIWRAQAARRRWRMPGRWLRVLLVLAAFAGVLTSYGRINGQHAGVALLVVMAALKLSELDRRRDVMVLVFLLYFVGSTHFLFSQEIWTLLWLIATAVAVTAMLIEANHAGEPLPLRVTLKRGGIMVAQAVPLMLLMFVLFPRVPGPLWGLPSDAGAARSGLSDSMSPGDISSLIQSDELAFRVRFDGAVPTPAQRYWRGPVFWHFNGRRWTAGALPRLPDSSLELAAVHYDYEMVLEPHRARWLFALDLPNPAQLPPGTQLAQDGTVLATREVKERALLHFRSHPQYRYQPQLSEHARRWALSLPDGYNPQSRALAQSWREQGKDDDAVVQAALTMFRSEEFFYTLQAPPLGRNSVDEFLFESRRGFCEHYASSFVVLMRMAGVPARVVTGYLGAEKNQIGEDYEVRQSDAHAWSEVWLGERGWVRVDPTAAVAPSRIENGIASALSLEEALPLNLRRRGSQLWGGLTARWDYANAQWNRWVLAYGPEVQKKFLSRFGLDQQRDMLLAMMVAVMAVAGVIGGVIAWRAWPLTIHDPALKAWRRATRRLAAAGLSQYPHEGPQHYTQRVIETAPALAAPMQSALAAYLALRYLAPNGSDTRAQLEQLRIAGKSLRI